MRCFLRCQLTTVVVLSVLFGVATPVSGQDNLSLTDSLIPEMESVFAENTGMIEHTQTVLGHAMEIQEQEGGALVIVKAAAILHDIGIPKAREVHGSSSGEYQEMEGPPIAREILTRLGFAAEQIDHICGIVANHHSDVDPRIVNTLEFKILWDADWLVNFPRRYRDASASEKAAAIGEIFKTDRGEELAQTMFLN
jgi:hypothetical protein